MSSDLVHGRVDAAGMLVAADPPLLNLQRKAGGDLGDKIALPQMGRLIGLALLAQRDLHRSILLGDDRAEIRGDAHIHVHADGADICISDWQSRPPRSQLPPPQCTPFVEGKSWIWECSAQWKLIALRSSHAELMLPPHWVGQDFATFFAIEDAPETAPHFHHAIKIGTAFDEVMGEAVDGAGQRCSFILSGMPQHNLFGQLTGYRGTAEWLDDGTESAAHNGGQGDGPDLAFNHRMDVELRTPLNRIISSAESIAGQFDGPIRADYSRYAADIAHAGRHLLGLVDDLSDAQSLESDDFQILADPIELGELARRACAMMQGKAKEKSIRIIAPHAIQRVMALGEYRRVLQIMINLIGNAVRYSPEDTKIWVEMAHVANHAQISVTDQGSGITAEDQDKVFEKYERLGRQDHGGSGLGLYISRRLARAMQGDLKVERALPFGARFTLTLPTAPN